MLLTFTSPQTSSHYFSTSKVNKMPDHRIEKGVFNVVLTVIGLMGCLGLVSACTEVVVPGAMTGGGELYRYTTSNVAKETVMGDERDVTEAARSALTQMDIRIHSVTPYTDETLILASTDELEITIKVIPVTASTTKVIVDAKEDHIIKKDKATADAILSQIRKTLARKDSNEEEFSRVFVKNNCKHRIYVAVRFLSAKNEPEHWTTRGWFTLGAGQKKHVADTHNRFIYFYAETRLKDQIYWGGDEFHWFEGQRFGFFKADFGHESGDITQSFGCD